MSRREVKLRPAARQDVAAAAAWYAEESGEIVARRFIDGVRATLDHIGNHPSSGSRRYATLCGLTGLRNLTLKGFPYMVFYIERREWADVLRVLHAARDIPESLRST